MANWRSVILNGSERQSATYEVGAVRKALEILCQFTAEEPSLSVSDLSRRLNIPKSTTHNLLRTLESYDFLKQDPADRRYWLGPRVCELGLRFSHGTRLVAAARPHLRKLADLTKETVKLGVLSGHEVFILTAIESPYQLHTRGDEGLRAPLHCTGLGKALLARLSDQEVREIVSGRGLPRFTPHTIATVAGLKKELERIRGDGYTVDREENELGVVCVAASLVDTSAGTKAALSVSAPASRLCGERITECARQVREAARAIEDALNQSRGNAPGRATWPPRPANRETE
jgi:DNA-binding IclR family transcriptional regulator